MKLDSLLPTNEKLASYGSYSSIVIKIRNHLQKILVRKSRGFFIRVFVVTQLFFLIILKFYFYPSTQYDAKIGPKPVLRSEGPLQIALVNSPHYHFEVLYPIIRSFSEQRLVEKFELFFIDRKEYRLKRLLQHQYHPSFEILKQQTEEEQKMDTPQLPIRNLTSLQEMGAKADVMILTSCSRDLVHFGGFWHPNDLEAPQEVVCVFHEVTEWEKPDTPWREAMQPWLDAGRMSALFLSPHVMEYAIENFERWNFTQVIKSKHSRNIKKKGIRMLRGFSPVFETGLDYEGEIHELSAATQGLFEKARRNYSGVFASLTKHLDFIKGRHMQLRLIGGTTREKLPVIDEKLIPIISFHRNADSPTFYTILSKTVAILPSFAEGPAGDKYFTTKASSSVATSLSIGVPLVVTKNLLQKYTYVPEDAVWIKENGETDIDAWVRIAKMKKEVLMEKKKAVRAARQKLIEGNSEAVDVFLNDAKARIRARSK